VSTDKLDYKPGETATLTASGFTPGSTVTFQIADDPTDPGADGDADVYAPIVVWDGADGVLDGAVTTTWFVPTTDDGSGHGPADALNATLLLSATGSDGLTANTTFTDSAPSVVTNKADYAPGETVVITASGFTPGSTIEFAVADDPSDPGGDGNADVYLPFSVKDGGTDDLDRAPNGQVVTTWVVPTTNDGTGSGTPDALNGTLNLTATGSDGQVAKTTFTDAIQRSYNQWQNYKGLSG
jgi:hypothetical protein